MIKLGHRIAFLGLILMLNYGQASAQLFKNGDRVCFVGNSITQNGSFFHQLAVYYATRFPDQRVAFINCGINGNVAANILSRIDSDILVNKPTWAVLKLGMNDVRKELYHPDSAAVAGIEKRREQALEIYRTNYVRIIERLLSAKCRLILQTPSIYDQTATIAAENYKGRNKALQRCAQIVRNLGLKYHLPVVDYQDIMLSVNRHLQQADPSATLIGPDRVHPGDAGHFVMAYQFLKTTLPSVPRSEITLDFAGKTEAGLAVKESVLPFPVDQEAASGSQLVPFKAFNSNRLTVKGLKSGSYTLTIDSIPIGKFTAQQLTTGIDLNANKQTPQYLQSLKVLSLFRTYWKMEADNRYVRLIETYHQPHNERYLTLKANFDANTAKMSELLDQIYRINKPVKHQFKLTPAGENIDVVAASQAGASALFFDAAIAPKIQVSAFSDVREVQKRNGLAAFFTKLKARKPVTIAYIGGSVTQMENKYRNQSARFLQSLYPGVKMSFINAGVSGTGTDLAACRLKYQVLDHQPDLVFVEFAVNGSFVPGLEGIIRQIHQANPNTGICLLYSISTGQSAIYADGKMPENIQNLEKLADHYGIPSIHMGLEVSALESAGKLVWKGDPELIKDKIVFSKDGTHPSTEGGNLYASAIARSVGKLAQFKGVKIEFAQPFTVDNWEDGTAVDPEQLNFSRDWKPLVAADSLSLKQFAPWFPRVLAADQAGSSVRFKFSGTKIGVFDIGGPEVGQLEVYVDGVRQAVINRFNRFCNNRYRGQYFFVDTKPGLHQVEFRIAAAIPDKKTILGESQLEDIQANPEKYQRHVIYIGKVLIKGRLVLEESKTGVTGQTERKFLPAGDTSFRIFPKLPEPGKMSSFHGYAMADFLFNGRNCKVVAPKSSAKGHPWIWRARFWGHEPQFDLAMLERGFHVVHCDVAELFGNGESVLLWNKFYQLMRNAGLAKKVVLEGMSRGGVYVYNWAAENPEKVACVYGDNPVLDLKSWPGGLGKGPGSKADWQKVLIDYGLTETTDLAAFKSSPINKTSKILKGKYPMLHVCGDADEVVPMEENTLPFERLIRAGGGDITVIHKPGFKHHPHSLIDPQPIVDFVMKVVGPKKLKK